MIRITRRVRRDSAYLIFVLILHSNLLCQAIPNIVARENKYVANNAENSSIGDIFVPDNYTTIQGAINAASEGNTIVVRSELYIEHVKVNKTVNLIGEGHPVIEGNGSSGFWGDACVMVFAHNVTVAGFILQHTGPLRESDVALGLAGISNCNVSHNVFRFSRGGIGMNTGDHNHTISDNLFQDLRGAAIWLNGYYNTVCNNVMSSCGGGIVVGYPQNALINNTITDCPTYGILLSAYLITMRHNTINETTYGFVTMEDLLSQLNNDIDATNTVDGRPIYYWINQSDRKVPLDAGYVALINSTNINADNLDLGRNGHGVLIAYSNNCTVTNCNITDNDRGLRILYSNNTRIYHNNIVNNYVQYDTNCMSSLDDGYPSGGNYWGANYTADDLQFGVFQNETGSDGIGDAPFIIDDNNRDNYPLVAPISTFDVGEWNGTPCSVDIFSNSTISHFQLNSSEKTLRFNVSGLDDSVGFCRLAVPNLIVQDLWQGNYTVLVDNQPPLEVMNWTDTENTYVYFTYQHSEHETIIIPELASKTLLLLPSIATIIAFYRLRKKLSKKHAEQAMRHKDTVSLVAIV